MIYFTADQHFGHANIIKFCGRPFANVEQMDQEMIRCWNEKIHPGDTVYHLGDFMLSRKIKDFITIINQLSGHIRFVPGGHDKWWVEKVMKCYGPKFIRQNGYAEFVFIEPPLVHLKFDGIQLPEITIEGEKHHPHPTLVLCHYPLREWEASFHGSFHLYGHTHGRLALLGRSLDIGVDSNCFHPWSITDAVLTLILKDIHNHTAPEGE